MTPGVRYENTSLSKNMVRASYRSCPNDLEINNGNTYLCLISLAMPLGL